MSILKTTVLFGSVFAITACIGLHLNTENVKADTVVTTQQGVVLKSTSISTSKTIKVPQKEVQTPITTTSKTTTSKTSNVSNSRGFSGGSPVASGGSSGVVNKAFEFLGRPYVYGASGPKAFDCSGFTAYVYNSFGVKLPHYTVTQSQMGQAVSRGNLRAGDLIFFNTSGYISHVGIYIEGDQFIHASSGSHKITVSILSEGYYSQRYVGARRILN